MKYKEGNPEIYNDFRVLILSHFPKFSSETFDLYVMRFFIPALGEGSCFYTREDEFGFRSLFR